MLLFLDIDGVLVPAKSWENPELLTDGFPAFDVKAVQILQKLISEDTTVMLTTSHKSRFSVEQWKEIFQKRGLKVNQLKTLEDNVNYLSRKDEVLNWFNLNSINEDFIIIDDDKSLNGLPAFLKERLILTSPLIGLTEEHWNEINVVLAKKQKVS